MQGVLGCVGKIHTVIASLQSNLLKNIKPSLIADISCKTEFSIMLE